MRQAVLSCMLAACSRPPVPSCETVEQHVAELTSAADRAVVARTGSGPFVPQFGDDFARRIGEMCTAGKLDRVALTCFADARSSVALDRCAAIHLP